MTESVQWLRNALLRLLRTPPGERRENGQMCEGGARRRHDTVTRLPPVTARRQRPNGAGHLAWIDNDDPG